MEKIMRRAMMQKNTLDKEYIALMKTYEYWKTNDYIESGNMSAIFKRLYMLPEQLKVTLVRISMDFGVSERSLLRYRKKFVAVFTYYINTLQNDN